LLRHNTATTPQPSFRAQQAEAFSYRFAPSEVVGLRSETSAPSRVFGGMKSLFAFDFAFLGACFSATHRTEA